MNTTNTITNQQERKEAISARLKYVLECTKTDTPKTVYILPSTGKQIDFAKQKNPWKLGRLVWRIGELRITACRNNLLAIKPLLKDELALYSFVWTLGRIGEAADAAIIKNILNNNLNSDKIVAVCFQSLLLLGTDMDIKTALVKDTPKKIITALKNHSFDDLNTVLQAALTPERCNNWLYWLYLLHWETPLVKTALLETLNTIPLQGNYFKPFRKIVKAAEHFEDMESLALLYWKMSHTAASANVATRGEWVQGENNRWHQTNIQRYAISWENGYQQTPIAEEVKKQNSSFGFTAQSKQYFKKKFLRVLWRSGDAGSPMFTKLATAYLLQVNDEQAAAAYSEPRYSYSRNESTGRWESHVKHLHYPLHFDNTALYRIIYANSAQYAVGEHRVQIFKDKAAGTKRSELFPQLWDAAPKDIIRLLAQSRAKLVQDFAAKVFKANPAFLAAIRPEDVVQMLARPYAQTQQIAVDAVRDSYARFESHKAVFLALLTCDNTAGQELAIAWLNTNKTQLLQDVDFITQLILHSVPNANKWIAEAIESPDCTAPQKSNLLTHLLMSLQAEQSAEHIQKLLAFIETHLKTQARQVSEQELRQLVAHPVAAVKVFAAQLMQQHQTPVAELPYELLLQLMASEQPEVRAAGIKLFGQLPDEKLYEEQVAVSSCCVSPSAEVRQAIKPTALRLSQRYPDFGEALTETLSDFLLMRGRANEVHNFIAELLTASEMSAFITELPRPKMWRLLRSKKYPAQQVGFAILETTTDARSLSMEDIVALGKHELKAVREWAQANIQAQKARATYEAAQTLRLLETDWEDSRQFMMDFAEREFKARDWTPELLVSLCDSTRDEVQAFGLRQIQTYFTQENALQFLAQLSQHPSARVQLLAAKWLDAHATDNLSLLRQLQPFFLTLLSQINKGRSAKQHAYAFLAQEALRSPEHAEVIIPLLERLVLTVAVKDKSNCMLLLNTIRRKYPHLTMRLQVNKPELATI